LAEVAKCPPLTRDEEARCIEHLWAGGEEAESAELRLVEANLALVVLIAEKYRDRGIHILDLIQSGNDALLLSLNASSPINLSIRCYPARQELHRLAKNADQPHIF